MNADGAQPIHPVMTEDEANKAAWPLVRDGKWHRVETHTEPDGMRKFYVDGALVAVVASPIN